MRPKVVTLIVPPGAGGVRDYAEIIADGLRSRGQDARLFAWKQEDENGIDAHIAASDCIYLQYSGYGFAQRGAPIWMLSALRERRATVKRLGIYFHELFASGPPWRSTFWLSPVQRQIASRLASLSDFWITNREMSHNWLMKHASDKPNLKLPVFSNVGEASQWVDNRQKIAVVFGSASRREKVYRAAIKPLVKWANINDIKLHDVGPAIKNSQLGKSLDESKIIRHGILNKEGVSAILLNSMFGLHVGSAQFIEKSGVFAAYSAHGVMPILVTERSHQATANTSQIYGFANNVFNHPTLCDHQIVGHHAWQWYQRHSSERHIEALDSMI